MESVEDLVGYKNFSKEQRRTNAIEDRAKIEEYAKKEEKTITNFSQKNTAIQTKKIFVKIRINAKLGKITNEDIDEMAKIGFIQNQKTQRHSSP